MIIYFLLAFILIILLILSYLIVFSTKNEVFCENFNSLNYLFNINTESKISYMRLDNSNVYKTANDMFNSKYQKLAIEKPIIQNKNYILALSKFIDYKINNTKTLFRSKQNIILIDKITSLIANDAIKNNKCDVFNQYKSLLDVYHLKQKENNMFKLLLSQKLIIELASIEDEINEISKVIIKSKNAKYIHLYRKNILKSAQIYGIYKYNHNSTTLLYKKFNKIKSNVFVYLSKCKSKNYKTDKNFSPKEKSIYYHYVIKEFFINLFDLEYKIKLIITYLNIMFR